MNIAQKNVAKTITVIICIILGVIGCATSIFGVLIITRLPNFPIPRLGLANIVAGALWIVVAGIGIYVVTNPKTKKWFF